MRLPRRGVYPECIEGLIAMTLLFPFPFNLSPEKRIIKTYLANSVNLISLIIVTLICPGYSISS